VTANAIEFFLKVLFCFTTTPGMIDLFFEATRGKARSGTEGYSGWTYLLSHKIALSQSCK
jgi:hypothetical protein